MRLILALLAGCPAPAPTVVEPTPSTPPLDTGGEPLPDEVALTVLLDGEPVQDAWVSVGGGEHRRTDADGRATLVLGDGFIIIASHPDARPAIVQGPGAVEVIALTRFSRTDNPDYVFQDAGEPGDEGSTAECGHCHQSMVIDWDASPHRTSASNPVVQAVYAGTSLHPDAASCLEAGGRWRTGLEPGTAQPIDRCYLGAGALPDLNPTCGDTTSCDGVASNTAGCADCHAPAIDGVLGGRDLLEATGRSFEDGVTCDLCHKVEAVDLTRPPGVGGALGILRPSEPSDSAGLAELALTFGPYPDVPNPRVRGVQRDHFRQAELCGACHELVQTAQIPGQALDAARWPAGLPVHSTHSEWSAGPYSPESPCQSCHMPPDPRWQNTWDYAYDNGLAPSVATGWRRPPGSSRRHSWVGPRSGDGTLLRLAAALELQTTVADGVLTAEVRVTNAGAGHALPTGEPHRAVLLVLEATCAGVPLVPVGGDVVPDYGGALDTKLVGEDWSTWPGAAVGDHIRVVGREGFRDYQGPLRFGDGSFTVEERGLPLDVFRDDAVVLDIIDGMVVLDHPLASGEVAYRVDGVGLPVSGELSRAWAGAPGFAFARVLVDAAGARQVPHHRAVDLASDNRLMPLESHVSTHVFAATCAQPEVVARLVHRPYPLLEARQKRYDGRDTVMVEVRR